MNKFQKEFVGLIKSALLNTPSVELSSEFDWGKALTLAKEHNIAVIVYTGAQICGVPTSSEAMKELFSLTCKSMLVSQRQVYEIERIEKAFKEENIDYMPLKGVLLKRMYPQPEMRSMGDADILIKIEQYPQVESVMKSLGFEFGKETDHEMVWKNSSLLVELHKSVMTTINKDFYSYYGSGWVKANKVSASCEYKMSLEDFYLYIFIHMTKHYRISGIGIKHILDLWVIAEKYPQLNKDRVAEELKKMHLYEFYLNIMKMIDAWFCDGEQTEKTDLITNVIFESGQYGSADMAVINRAIQTGNGSATKARSSKFFNRLFPPYSEMKKKYEVLNKCPVLLPIMWFVRCVDVVFFKRKDLDRYMQEMKMINSKNIEEHTKALNYVGLSFDNESIGDLK